MPNHCKACENEDDDEMVQCDECDEWYHYTCVGVDHEIEDHEWKCVKCRTSSLEKVHNDTNTNVTDQPTSPLSSTAGNAFEASQQLIPIQQSAVPPHQQTEGSPPCTSKQSSVASKDATAANSQKALDLSKANDNSLENKKQQPMTLINKRSSLLLQQLEEERQLQAQGDMEYIKKKYALLKELEIEADNNHSIQQSYTTQHPANNPKSVAVAKSNLFGPRDDWNSTFCHKPVSQPLMSTMKQTSALHHLATPASNFSAPSNEKPTANQFSFSKSCETLTPNKQQLAARQIMSKEVVTFSGRVEEWPRFISWFNNTTVSCGYTNTDNLSRLQHCLKDDALRTVGVRLFLPDQVPAAMKSLQMLYGRPEAIIDSLLETIRKEPTPRMEKLQTLIRFSLSVQNACAVMIGSGLNDHLSNPSLLRELTERLPPSIRLNWGEFRKNLNLVTLLTFSEWLEDVAQSASVVMPLSTTNFSARSERSSNKSSVNLHQASQSQPSTLQSPSSGNSRCPLCDQSCNSLEHCQKFLGLNLNERWNAISRFFFCRTCLRRHRRNRCRLLKECGVEGCTFKHHKLLHKTRETTIAAPRMNCYHKMDKCSILFRIVPVTLYNDEIRINTYAFLDDGSSISLIDDEIATKLNATGEPQPLCLKWTSNTHRTEKSSRLINLQISSTFSSKKYEVSNLHTVKSLDLPKQSINAEEICRRHHHLKNIPLQTYTNAKPQLLLGLDQWKLTIPLRSHEGRADEPVASKTRLGWTVYGSCLGSSSKNQSLNYHNFHSCDCQDLEEQKLSTQFKEFIAIDLEGVTTKKILRSADDEKAMSIISENMTRRAEANNFVVPLLWKVTPTQMPDSRPMAEGRLIHLEKNCLVT